MKSTEKPRYTMWQNTFFMLHNAWNTCKSVIFVTMALPLASTVISLTELLITPMILREIENASPFSTILTVILLFSGMLLLFSAIKTYLETNAMMGRIEVRTHILQQVASKTAQTSYPNTLDTRFLEYENKAFKSCSANDEATEFFWTTWSQILSQILGFVAYLALLSSLHPLLLLVITLTAAFSYVFNKRVNEWRYQYQEKINSFTKKNEYLRRITTHRVHAKDIRIFGIKAWIDEIWENTYQLYRAVISKRERVYLWRDLVNLILVFLRNGIAYAYLIWLALAQNISASQFLLYFTAVSGFTQWITGILDQFQALHRQSLDLSMLREFLAWPEPFLFEEGKPLCRTSLSSYEIRLENVSYRYPHAEEDTIHQLSLTIPAGEKLAIVGLNGAGKTTLVKLICGFLDPTEGRVLLNGQDIRQYNRRDYYALFSSVFQNFSLLEASIAVNVAQRVQNIDEDRVWHCLDLAGLKEVILALPQGIHTHLGRTVYLDGIELSGGQIQRLMLARALYKNGPILALDEPTAALDPLAEAEIYRNFDAIITDKTAIYISHRLSSCRFCDEIAVFEDGAVVQQGSHEVLVQDPTGPYYALWHAQAQYYTAPRPFF